MNTNNQSNKPTPAARFKVELDHAKRRATTAQHKRIVAASFARLPQVRQAFVTLAKATRNGEQPWVSVADYGAEVTVGLTLRDLDSFKDAHLTSLVERFAGDEWTSSTHDYTYAAPNRDFRFSMTLENPLDTPALRMTATEQRSLKWLVDHAQHDLPRSFSLVVSLYAYVKADSNACRIEVVGIEEQVVKREVKRIVCA